MEQLRTIDALIDEIDAIIGTPGEEYDPANPAINPAWDHLRSTDRPVAEDPANRPATPPPPAATSTEGHRRIPTAGQRHERVIQPSDWRNRAKQEWLTNPPPAMPRHRRPAPPPETPRPTLEPARVMGPLPPPPIPVEVEPGHIIEVPHFSAHVARQWKTKSRGQRWHIRFNGNGSVRKVRKMPPRGE